MALTVPLKYKTYIDKILEAGFEVYLVGGCVRDYFLKKEVKDYDVVTPALPEEMLKLFPNAITPGQKFGIVRVPIGEGEFLDIATTRKDGPYTDGRHPDFVAYASVSEDVLRRDFTINGLMWDLTQQKVVDLVEGMKDLKNKELKAIGVAEERLQEDPLRMWRAMRFLVKLGFSLEEKTKEAILKFSSKASSISHERITSELKQSLEINSQETFQKMLELGLVSHFKIKTLPSTKEQLSYQESLLFLSEQLSSGNIGDYLTLTSEELRFVLKGQEYLRVLKNFSSLSLKEKNRLKFSPLRKTMEEFLKKTSGEEVDWSYSSMTSEQVDKLSVTAKELMSLGYVGGKISATQKALYEEILAETVQSPEERERFLKDKLTS